MTGGPFTDDPETAIEIAMRARDAGRSVDALPVLKSVIGAHPRNPRLWQTLGVVLRDVQDSAAAIAAFAEAARLAPGDVKPAYGVAQSMLEAGRPATAAFDRARRLAPGDGSLLLGRAAAQLAEGLGGQAIADLDTVVRNNPGWSEGQSTLARLRWQMGAGDEFDSAYERASTGLSGAHPLWIEWINLVIEVGRHAQADCIVAKARAAGCPDDLLAPLEAVIASELGDRPRADRLFAALEDRPDIAIAERHIRHLLRTARADVAAARAEPLLAHPMANTIWPYAGLAWRLTGDLRADWLEGDRTLITVIDLEMDGDIDALAARLRSIHRAMSTPLGQSVRGGTQTDGPLFAREEPEIRSLRASLVEAVERHISGMGARDSKHPVLRHIGKPFRFSGSWSVRLGAAGHHSNHIHPQGWLSSAFYVSLPEQSVMGPPPAGWLHLGSPPKELGIDLPAYRMVEPKAGRLVLFPSIMWHGTQPILEGERLTIAFDVAAVG